MVVCLKWWWWCALSVTNVRTQCGEEHVCCEDSRAREAVQQCGFACGGGVGVGHHHHTIIIIIIIITPSHHNTIKSKNHHHIVAATVSQRQRKFNVKVRAKLSQRVYLGVCDRQIGIDK